MENRTSKTLLSLALKYDNDFYTITEVMKNKSFFFEDSEIEKNYKKYKGKYISCVDDDYPPLYKEMLMNNQEAPYVIFKNKGEK